MTYKGQQKNISDIQLAKRYLNIDKVKYADMITGLDLNMVNVEYASERGVLLYYPELTTYSVAVFSGDYNFMLSMFTKCNDCIITHDNGAYDIVSKNYKIKREAICYNAVWTLKEYPKLRGNCEIKAISLPYFDYVNSKYTRYDASEEIRYNLSHGRMLGAFIDSKIVGYIGFHGEGSIGMLYVDENYRRLGIGGDLLIEQLKYAKKNNLSTYTQIVKGNEPSLKMHLTLGFEVSKSADIVWHILDTNE